MQEYERRSLYMTALISNRMSEEEMTLDELLRVISDEKRRQLILLFDEKNEVTMGDLNIIGIQQVEFIHQHGAKLEDLDIIEIDEEMLSVTKGENWGEAYSMLDVMAKRISA